MECNLSSWHIWKQSWILRSPCGNGIHVPIRSFEIVSMLSGCSRVEMVPMENGQWRVFSPCGLKSQHTPLVPDLPQMYPRTSWDRPPLAGVRGAGGADTQLCIWTEDRNRYDRILLFSLLRCFLVGGAWLRGGWQLVKPHSHKFRFSTRVRVYHRRAYAHAISGGDYKNC